VGVEFSLSAACPAADYYPIEEAGRKFEKLRHRAQDGIPFGLRKDRVPRTAK